MSGLIPGLALALSWGLGLCWLWPLRGNRPLWLGYGYLLGMLASALVLWLVDRLGGPLWLPLLFLVLGLLYVPGILLNRRLAPVAPLARPAPTALWQRWVIALLLGLLLVRLAGLATELWLRPLTPWDAWTVWGLRARLWTELGHLAPFVDPNTWLNDPTGEAYTGIAWHYPLTVSLIQTWAALAWGGWSAGAANLPWLLCALALALGLYGQARQAGVGALAATVGVYLLLTLPLLNAHIALAGYADLWLAATFGLAAMALLQWLAGGGRWQLVLAVVLALACPLIKLEGAVWAALLLPLLVFRLPGRWPLLPLGAMAVVAVVWYLNGGIQWGPFTLTQTLVDLPYIGRYELAYTNSWQALFDNLLAQGSWHLLWYLVPLAALAGLPRILRDRRLLAASLLILLGLAMLYVLFFHTNAEEFARRGTSLNRLFLHLTPVVLFWMLLLTRTPGTAPRSDPPPDR
jgi:hypothetical protein